MVLTLCGVLKDIILVFASIAIWGTHVSTLQFFGYGIALGGMLYYKLGAEQIKGHFAELGRMWAEYGAKRPAQRKIVVFALVIVTLFLLLGGLAPAVGVDTSSVTAGANKFAGLLNAGAQSLPGSKSS